MNNIRIKLNKETDNSYVKVHLDQEFDNLEVLSLNISSSEAYTLSCANHGVIVGRVVLNNGLGVQNAKVSVFIPISEDDKNRTEIFELYPFETISDTYPNGVRYNLLPRIRNERNPSHRAVGNFPDETDLIHYPAFVEIMDKYYKFTTITNDSGDYMIFGVPVGQHNVVMDFDIFDTNSIDVTANDLVDQITLSKSLTDIETLLNTASNEDPMNPSTININKVPNFIYKGNNNYEIEVKVNLDEMPNIFHEVKQINVSPFWGDDDVCDIGITRCDFTIDFKYIPTAVFFGYLHAPSENYYIKHDYTFSNPDGIEIKPYDGLEGTKSNGLYPFQNIEIVVYRLNETLEIGTMQRVGVYKGSNYNGVFKINLPLYMDHYITNEFGDLVPTKDTVNGLPTKGYYAFEIYDTQEAWNGRRVVRGGFKNNILLGARIPSTNQGDIWLGGWEGTWGGLFEYDVINRRKKFYTVKTTHFKHSANNVLLEGDDICYFPTINKNYSDLTWNFPIDRKELNTISTPYIIGSILVPRVQIELDGDKVKHPSRIVSLPYIDKSDSYNEWVFNYEYYLGLGVKKDNGVNSGTIYTSLFSSDLFIDSDGNNVFGDKSTWNFGDNSNVIFNASLYAIEMAKRDGSNANEFNVHKAYNQVVFDKHTFGAFVNSLNSSQQNKDQLIEIVIYDITDELKGLIDNNVYSSYNKGTITTQTEQINYNEIYVESTLNLSLTETSDSLKNTFNGKFYYFGLYSSANALYHIEKYYYIK